MGGNGCVRLMKCAWEYVCACEGVCVIVRVSGCTCCVKECEWMHACEGVRVSVSVRGCVSVRVSGCTCVREGV